jgi:hypothetical protein
MGNWNVGSEALPSDRHIRRVRYPLKLGLSHWSMLCLHDWLKGQAPSRPMKTPANLAGVYLDRRSVLP